MIAIKVTANKPAADIVFRNAPFIIVEVGGGEVCLLGGSSDLTLPIIPRHIFPVEPRQLGGFAAQIEGETAAQMLDILKPDSERPFYSLEPTPQHRYRMVGGHASLPRHVPWIRIWLRSDAPEVEPPILNAEMLTAAIRDAEALLKGHAQGRPSNDKAAAREFLGAFKNEAKRIGLVRADTGPITSAIDMLERYVERLSAGRRTTNHSITTVREAIRIAEHSSTPAVQSALEHLVLLTSLAPEQADDDEHEEEPPPRSRPRR